MDYELSILQFVDDTNLFMDHDLINVPTMKLTFSTFKQLSRLKVRSRKSELHYFRIAKEHELEYTHLFDYSVGSFPFKYVGSATHYRKAHIGDWKAIEYPFEKCLDSCRSNNLCCGCRSPY